MNPRRLVHVRADRRGDKYVAQSLELDIYGEGETAVQALDHFRVCAIGQTLHDKDGGRDPFSTTPCAPINFWCDIPRDSIVGVYLDELTRVVDGTAERELRESIDRETKQS